jgi:WD40 repeat protein
MFGGIKKRPADAPHLKGRWQADIGDYVNALAWSPDGALLAAASVSGPIHIFNTADGTTVRTLPGHVMGTTHIAWRPDRKVLASIGQDSKACLWDVATGTRTVLALNESWGERVAWSYDGAVLATAAGKRVYLWNADGTPLRQYPAHGSTVLDIRWKPNSKILAAGAYGGATLWQHDQDIPFKQLTWQGATLTLAWSPNGRYLAAGQQDASIVFWDQNATEPLMMSGYPSKIRELAWDRRSRFLASGGSDTIVVWDCSGKGPAGSKPQMLYGHDELLTALMYQHNGDVLASGGQDGVLLLWWPNKLDQPIGGVRGLGAVSHVVWSDNDKLLAAGDAEGVVRAFDVGTG